MNPWNSMVFMNISETGRGGGEEMAVYHGVLLKLSGEALKAEGMICLISTR